MKQVQSVDQVINSDTNDLFFGNSKNVSGQLFENKIFKIGMLTLAVVVIARLSQADPGVATVVEKSVDSSSSLNWDIPNAKSLNECLTQKTQKIQCTGNWLGQAIRVDIQNKPACQYYRYSDWGDWQIEVSSEGQAIAELSKQVTAPEIGLIKEDKMYSFQKSEVSLNEIFEILFEKNERQQSGSIHIKTIQSFTVHPPANGCYGIGKNCEKGQYCKPGSKLTEDYCYKKTLYNLHQEKFDLSELKCNYTFL